LWRCSSHCSRTESAHSSTAASGGFHSKRHALALLGADSLQVYYLVKVLGEAPGEDRAKADPKRDSTAVKKPPSTIRKKRVRAGR
jgi:hypothetical protein